MPKQLVGFSLLWSFVLFLATPIPALGNIYSNCTVGDSPGKCAVAQYMVYSAQT